MNDIQLKLLRICLGELLERYVCDSCSEMYHFSELVPDRAMRHEIVKAGLSGPDAVWYDSNDNYDIVDKTTIVKWLLKTLY